MVRNQFWLILVKGTTKDVIRKYVERPSLQSEVSLSEVIMNHLSRVRISCPFTHCGVDFGDPFLIQEYKRRNAKLIKAYICIFIYFATKVIHIELITICHLNHF